MKARHVQFKVNVEPPPGWDTSFTIDYSKRLVRMVSPEGSRAIPFESVAWMDEPVDVKPKAEHPCKTCGKVFGSPTQLGAHRYQSHRGEK